MSDRITQDFSVISAQLQIETPSVKAKELSSVDQVIQTASQPAFQELQGILQGTIETLSDRKANVESHLQTKRSALNEVADLKNVSSQNLKALNNKGERQQKELPAKVSNYLQKKRKFKISR